VFVNCSLINSSVNHLSEAMDPSRTVSLTEKVAAIGSLHSRTVQEDPVRDDPVRVLSSRKPSRDDPVHF